MKPPRLFFLLLLSGALHAADNHPPVNNPVPAQPPLPTDRYSVLKRRIDALFKLRTNPPPFASDSPNPFYLPSDTPASTDAAKPLATARVDLRRPLTDAELLPRLAAGLRMGGVMELGDAKPRVIINQRSYREGDTLPLRYQDQTVKLILKALDAERLILALNDAEITIRLKKPR